jgi:hypothetical protein
MTQVFIWVENFVRTFLMQPLWIIQLTISLLGHSFFAMQPNKLIYPTQVFIWVKISLLGHSFSAMQPLWIIHSNVFLSVHPLLKKIANQIKIKTRNNALLLLLLYNFKMFNFVEL